ncbi:hypothetical protein TNCV_1875981 [Trichonephila clavipes]|nr:hypothetical protein TNCV_1875981 [Trichonephila clavipes]
MWLQSSNFKHRFTTLETKTTGTAIRGFSSGRLKSHPQMTGTLSNRPEETGGNSGRNRLMTDISRFTVARRLQVGLFAIKIYFSDLPAHYSVYRYNAIVVGI